MENSFDKMRLFERGLSVANLKRMFNYDPASGHLFWKEVLGSPGATKRKYGHRAGCLNGAGYTVVKIKKRWFRAHRIIWAIQTGAWPAHFVDHVNTIKNDNRWANLRAATFSENNLNRAKETSVSGLRRVIWNAPSRKWLARVKHRGKLYHLGSFSDPNEAYKVASAEAMRLHGERARCD